VGVSIFFVLACHERDFGGHVSRMLQNTRNEKSSDLSFRCVYMFSSIRVVPSKDDTNSFAFNEAKQRDHISPLRPFHFIMGRLG